MPIINGKKEDIKNISFFEYLTQNGYDTNTIVVECNLNIIKKDSWKTTMIQVNDKIEILSFVGGG